MGRRTCFYDRHRCGVVLLRRTSCSSRTLPIHRPTRSDIIGCKEINYLGQHELKNFPSIYLPQSPLLSLPPPPDPLIPIPLSHNAILTSTPPFQKATPRTPIPLHRQSSKHFVTALRPTSCFQLSIRRFQFLTSLRGQSVAKENAEPQGSGVLKFFPTYSCVLKIGCSAKKVQMCVQGV